MEGKEMDSDQEKLFFSFEYKGIVYFVMKDEWEKFRNFENEVLNIFRNSDIPGKKDGEIMKVEFKIMKEEINDSDKEIIYFSKNPLVITEDDINRFLKE